MPRHQGWILPPAAGCILGRARVASPSPFQQLSSAPGKSLICRCSTSCRRWLRKLKKTLPWFPPCGFSSVNKCRKSWGSSGERERFCPGIAEPCGASGSVERCGRARPRFQHCGPCGGIDNPPQWCQTARPCPVAGSTVAGAQGQRRSPVPALNVLLTAGCLRRLWAGVQPGGAQPRGSTVSGATATL